MIVGLSTSSVYPGTTAQGFAYAAELGYDAVEVMVGIDALSQQVAAVEQLAEHHDVPVCAVHAPCLLFTQAVWGLEPWGKLERSAAMAKALGADVVVVHPPFRWQRDYARDFVNGPQGKSLNLRGRYARIVFGGTIRGTVVDVDGGAWRYLNTFRLQIDQDGEFRVVVDKFHLTPIG